MPADQISGLLWFVMIAALVLTIPLSLLLLRRYREAVRAGMSSGHATDEFDSSVTAADRTLAIEQIHVSTFGQLPSDCMTKLQQRTKAVVTAYMVAGMLHALLLSVLYFVKSDLEISFWRVAAFMLVFIVPQLFVFNLITSATRKQQWKNTIRLSGGWLLLNGALWWFAASGPFYQQFVPLLLYNAFPVAMVLLLRIRSIRNAALPVLALMMVSVGGGFLFINLLGNRSELLEKVSGLLSHTGMSGRMQFVFLILTGMAVSALAGWWMLQQFKKWYLKKLINDRMLAADSYMLLFTLYYSLVMFSKAPQHLLWGLLLLAIYKVVQLQLLRRITKPASPPPSLLLLRVFALGNKSSTLFRLLKTRWRNAGTIQLITGTDLAMETADPNELLDFVAGNLKRNFCIDENTLKQNIEKADHLPDADGSYRINEMMCTNSTWKMALRELVGRSNVVLMDLRSFSAQFQGCVYELHALVNLMPMSRCVLLTDATTDTEFLRSTLKDAFRLAVADSPNVNNEKATANLYHFENGDDEKMEALMRLLCHKADG